MKNLEQIDKALDRRGIKAMCLLLDNLHSCKYCPNRAGYAVIGKSCYKGLYNKITSCKGHKPIIDSIISNYIAVIKQRYEKYTNLKRIDLMQQLDLDVCYFLFDYACRECPKRKNDECSYSIEDYEQDYYPCLPPCEGLCGKVIKEAEEQ